VLGYLLSFLLSFTIVFASSSQKDPTYLNSIRKHVGLIPLKTNSKLNRSALSHAKYLIRHQKTGHYEQRNKKGYTGKNPSSRVRYTGYLSSIIKENISIHTQGNQASIKNLMSAIYHRFTFLSFMTEEIGIGHAHTNSRKSIQDISVYNLGSSHLSKLCQKYFSLIYGQYYIQDICSDASKRIPIENFKKEKMAIARRNAKVLYYPYAGERNIWPAFYNENPDPLPKYKVSGFPISVQFNPAYYQNIKLKKFRLYDSQGKEIQKTKILHKQNDPNHVFTTLEFALMPLARLEFGEKYTVIFEARADNKLIKKRWSFRTSMPKGKYFRISKNKETIHVNSGNTVILYIVPSHRRDILKSYTMKEALKIKFLDQNTLKIILPKQKNASTLTIKFSNNKRVTLKIKGH